MCVGGYSPEKWSGWNWPTGSSATGLLKVLDCCDDAISDLMFKSRYIIPKLHFLFEFWKINPKYEASYFFAFYMEIMNDVSAPENFYEAEINERMSLCWKMLTMYLIFELGVIVKVWCGWVRDVFGGVCWVRPGSPLYLIPPCGPRFRCLSKFYDSIHIWANNPNNLCYLIVDTAVSGYCCSSEEDMYPVD